MCDPQPVDVVAKIAYNCGVAGKFHEVRTIVVNALQAGNYQFESRVAFDEKNYLQLGRVDEQFVIGAILATRGQDVERGVHDQMPSVEIWVLKPLIKRRRWYIKFYILEDVYFISVHPAKFGR